MRYLSGCLVLFLGIGCVNAASAETTCLRDIFEFDDSVFLGVTGDKVLTPYDQPKCPGITGSGGPPQQAACKKPLDRVECLISLLDEPVDLEYPTHLLECGLTSDPEICRASLEQGKEDATSRYLDDCVKRSQDDYKKCLTKKSARLPQKTCRANAKHGKQARAGFTQTQRGCSSKAPTKASKSNVKAPKLTQTKAIKR